MQWRGTITVFVVDVCASADGRSDAVDIVVLHCGQQLIVHIRTHSLSTVQSTRTLTNQSHTQKASTTEIINTSAIA
eukprot:m.234753 g.234753  ORF g.234753 m.234753 type:complete len:76 (+) comp17089_c0_seq7:124-351(+)